MATRRLGIAMGTAILGLSGVSACRNDASVDAPAGVAKTNPNEVAVAVAPDVSPSAALVVSASIPRQLTDPVVTANAEGVITWTWSADRRVTIGPDRSVTATGFSSKDEARIREGLIPVSAAAVAELLRSSSAKEVTKDPVTLDAIRRRGLIVAFSRGVAPEAGLIEPVVTLGDGPNAATTYFEFPDIENLKSGNVLGAYPGDDSVTIAGLVLQGTRSVELAGERALLLSDPVLGLTWLVGQVPSGVDEVSKVVVTNDGRRVESSFAIADWLA